MSASSSTSLPASVPLLMKDVRPRTWAELPSDFMSSILLRLSVVDILDSAQKVCSPWRHACKDPLMWRKIDMGDLGERGFHEFDFDIMCRHAVDLSQGGLLEINIAHLTSDSLLTYIADRSRNLKSLGLQIYGTSTTNKVLANAISKLPLLETLEVSHTSCKLDLKGIGQACPQLKTLKLNSSGSSGYVPYHIKSGNNVYALEIAENMPELRHLQLLGDKLTDFGVKAILNGCPHLEHLDLRQCFNVFLNGNLEKQCLEIKEFRSPHDSTDDYPFQITFNGFGNYSDDDDHYVDNGNDNVVYYPPSIFRTRR